MANRLQDDLLLIAGRIGAIEDERDRLKEMLRAERDALWLRDQEIKKLKEELAAFPLLPEHGEAAGETTGVVGVGLKPAPTAGGEQSAGGVQTLGRYPY